MASVLVADGTLFKAFSSAAFPSLNSLLSPLLTAVSTDDLVAEEVMLLSVVSEDAAAAAAAAAAFLASWFFFSFFQHTYKLLIVLFFRFLVNLQFFQHGLGVLSVDLQLL